MTEDKLIEKFAKVMLAKLDKRQDRYIKEGWKTLNPTRISFLLKEELRELEVALDGNAYHDPIEEAVDIANYAFFMWYILTYGTKTKEGKDTGKSNTSSNLGVSSA